MSHEFALDAKVLFDANVQFAAPGPTFVTKAVQGRRVLPVTMEWTGNLVIDTSTTGVLGVQVSMNRRVLSLDNEFNNPANWIDLATIGFDKLPNAVPDKLADVFENLLFPAVRFRMTFTAGSGTFKVAVA